MPAVNTQNVLVLPRIPRPDPATAQIRAVGRVVAAHKTLEGAGFPVSRPFCGLRLQIVVQNPHQLRRQTRCPLVLAELLHFRDKPLEFEKAGIPEATLKALETPAEKRTAEQRSLLPCRGTSCAKSLCSAAPINTGTPMMLCVMARSECREHRQEAYRASISLAHGNFETADQ